ncbi:MAG: glycosyltransferase family 4 protein [Actinomycetota bacterium]
MERLLGSAVEYLDPDRFESMILLREGGPLLAHYQRFAATHLYTPPAVPPRRRFARLRHRGRRTAAAPADPLEGWARKVVTGFDPHVIVFHHSVEIPRYTPLADLGVPTIQTFTQHWSMMSTYSEAWLETLASRTHYQCEGQTSVANARFLLGIPEDRISVFCIGPDQPERDRQLADPARPRRADLGIPDDALVVCTVGNLGISKGADIWLRAAAELRRRRPDVPWRFLWVGGSEAQWNGVRGQVLHRIVADLDLADVVTFVPQVRNVFAYGAMADIYVQPSRDDAFPGATLEAMSMAKPVVSFPIGIGAEPAAIDALVRVDVIGPVALADGIERLAEDPVLRTRLGEAGRRLVDEQYEIRDVVRRYGELIESVVARGLD